MATRSAHAEVVRIAARQHLAIAATQLRTLGLSRNWVHGNVRSTFLTPVVPGVFVVGLDVGDLPRDTCASIAILRGRACSSLYRETAAEWLGLWNRGGADIHVASGGAGFDPVRGLAPNVSVHSHRVHGMPESDVIVIRGHRVVGAARTILDLGRVLGPFQLAHVIWNALYAELVTLPELERRCRASARTTGMATVRAALVLIASGSCGSKSRSEDEFLAILDRANLPVPLVNVLGSAGLVGVRLDFVWPEQGVVLELDGRHHAGMPGIRASDRSVIQRLRRDGWDARRMHYSRVWEDPIGVVGSMAAALGR